MPRKFSRTSHLEAARNRLSRDYGERDYGPPQRRRLTPRNRLLVIYLGLFSFVLMVLVYEVFTRTVGFEAGTVTHAVGVITERESFTTPEGAPALRFEVETVLPDGSTSRGTIAVSVAYGGALEVGDRVGILYRRLAGRIRIEQIGAVALPASAG